MINDTDLRKPINTDNSNLHNDKGSTRSKRNIDEMNDRLSNFTPLCGNSAYPLFNQRFMNFDNKPISTRCNNGNKQESKTK